MLKYWLEVANTRAKNLEKNTADAFFSSLNHRISDGIWLWAIILSAQFLKLPATVSEYLYIALQIYLIIAVKLLILKAVAAIVSSSPRKRYSPVHP
ncbi:hypothetical protein [Nostoc sp.]|uniref:hypothetical protein n=1 Tax=Nostoc sp. TaxID=1180 RepID=UPI002FFA9F08